MLAELLEFAIVGLVIGGAVIAYVVVMVILFSSRSKEIKARIKQNKEMEAIKQAESEERRVELAREEAEMRKDVARYERVVCPYCNSILDLPKGTKFHCEHCGYSSDEIVGSVMIQGQ